MKKKIIQYKKKIYYKSFFVFVGRIIAKIILLKLKIRIKEVKGKIPKKSHLLIASHHEDIADQYIIDAKIKRRLFWIADTTRPHTKISLADTKFTKWLLLRLGAIPIDKEDQKRNINLPDYLFYLLGKGEAIVFFPESYLRCERNNKKFGKFKDGVIKLALEYEKRFNKKIPVYPIGLSYTKSKKGREANLRIGKKILIKSLKDKTKLFNKIKTLSL